MGNGTDKPNKALERAVGVGGAVITGSWIFTRAIQLNDWISRGQTMKALDPYVHYFVMPWAQILELAGIAALLFYATRLEHFREADETPRIILLPSREPEKPKRHWFWLKLGIGSAVLSFIVALLIFGFLRRNHPQDRVVASSPSKSSPASLPDAGQSTSAGHAGDKRRPANPSKITQTSPVQAAPSAKTPPPPPIVIPVPDKPLSPRPAGGKSTVKYVAKVDNQIVRASDKAPGTLYVSLRTAGSSKYLGNISQTDIENVTEALKKTGKVSVFINTTGGYGITGNGLSYSLNMTPAHPRTIYFFDTSLENTCAALKNIVSGIVGQMDCKFVKIDASSDPNGPSVQHDFLMESGLDMEVVL